MILQNWIVKITMLFIFFFALMTEVAYAQSVKALPTPKTAHIQAKQGVIRGVHVNGNIHITVKQIAGKQRDRVIVPRKYRYAVNSRIRHNTVYISKRPDHPGRVKLTVLIHRIDHLRLTGNASFNGRIDNSKALSIRAYDHSRIKLKGKINLKRLVANGSSKINLEWVNAKSLNIHSANNARIRLAGVANQVRASINGNSKLNAQYLRAKTAIVQTHGSASAKIMAINNLRAFAFDKSNIYYYKQPSHITRFTRNSGNVLQLDWRP